jgi:DNA topoisomerase I
MARFLKEAGAFDTIKQTKRALRAAIGRVAAALGNTPPVCRKSYIHPAVISAYMDRKFVFETAAKASNSSGDGTSGLLPEEAAVLARLRG